MWQTPSLSIKHSTGHRLGVVGNGLVTGRSGIWVWSGLSSLQTVRGSTVTEIDWSGTIVTICVSYFTTGSPSKEHGTSKSPSTRRVQERSKGDTTCLTISQNPSHWHPSWLSNACATKKDSESDDWSKKTQKLIPSS